MLVRQYHPDLNAGISLTQIPPVADVWVQWQCDVGHRFIATPEEQRMRPGRQRRRSSWCPVCLELAAPRSNTLPMRPGRLGVDHPGGQDAASTARSEPPAPPRRPGARRPSVERRLCPLTPALAPGEPFSSACAPPPASAAEAELRAAIAARLDFAGGATAVRLTRPFFEHLEAWPDILLPDLRVAIEYDTTGRHGLEHVGRRQVADLRKDRLLRETGWEVIRVRTGKLPALGPFDLCVSGVTARLPGLVLDRLRDIRGPFFVDAYLR